MFHAEKAGAEATGATFPTKRWHNVKPRILAKCGEPRQTPPPNGILLWHTCLGRPAGLPAVRLSGRATLCEEHRGAGGTYFGLWRRFPGCRPHRRCRRLFGGGRQDGFQVMDWNKPRNAWQWLLLFSPSVAAIAASQIAKWWMLPVAPLHFATGDIMDVSTHLNRLFPLTFFLITGLSFILAIVLTRGIPPVQRLFSVILALLCLVLLNGVVAFSGCAVRGLLVPDPVSQ